MTLKRQIKRCYAFKMKVIVLPIKSKFFSIQRHKLRNYISFVLEKNLPNSQGVL